MTDEPKYVELAARIVAAFVGNNALSIGDLPPAIRSVHDSLRSLSNPTPAVTPEKPKPAVPIRKSITPDQLISLEDGMPYRTLTRHLSVRGLTPEQYREKWGLPKDYPMVAPNYTARRSEIAKSFGLGRKAGVPAPKRKTPTKAQQ